MANKHTTGAGLVFFICVGVSKVTPKIAAIWFPGHAAQIQQTEEVITEAVKDFSVGYGLLMGSDAQKPNDGSYPDGLTPPPSNSNPVKTAALIVGFFVLAFEIHRLI